MLDPDFRERRSNISLDFPTFGSSDHIGPRSKVVLHGEGYPWAQVLGSFDNSKRYESSPTRLFSIFKGFVNDLVGLRP